MSWLNLSGLGLSSLRNVDIPDDVTHLNISDNILTDLYGCPKWITHLDCSNNNITSLSGCPPKLKELTISCNRIESLEECPGSLKMLIITYNKIKSLKGCSQCLKILDISHNMLDSIEYIPVRLKEFTATDNMITTLESLPRSVHTINVLRNPLISKYKFKTAYQIHCINRGLMGRLSGVAKRKLDYALKHNEKLVIEYILRNPDNINMYSQSEYDIEEWVSRISYQGMGQ